MADRERVLGGYGREWKDSDLGGYYARDTHRGGFGDDYARESRVAPTQSFRGRGPKNYRRSDTRIADDVHQRLTDDHDLDATNIDVAVENGVVTLNGSVANRWAKRYAEDLVATCSGVEDVQNRLTLENLDRQRVGKASE